MESIFRLEGDTVIRLSTGKPVRCKNGPYAAVGYTEDGTYKRVYLHRLKFYLAHKYWPPEVDHRDRDPSNPSISNLRAATRRQNLANRRIRKRDLPLGVRAIKRKGEPRYYAEVRVHGRSVYLGSFDTVDGAAAAVQDRRRAEYGEFLIG